MKKFSLARTLTIIITTIIVFISCKNSGHEIKSSPQETKSSPIDGAWLTVWGRYNGEVYSPEKPYQFKMFSNGYFALIAQDSTGKFDFGGYGKFELQGKTFKETFLYHNNPDYIGAMNWQEYELKGDTLYFRGFNKVIVKGIDSTASFPKIEEKRVRAK